MTFIARSSTPLSPLAEMMRDMTERASDFCAATAFLSREVVDTVLAAGLADGTRIRLLTGTFGRQTRKAVFRRLLTLSKRADAFDVRVWDCGRHRNLHAKIFVWRFPNGTGVAWIGSANLTLGGLQAEGEIVFEVRQKWQGDELSVIRQAFEREWTRSFRLDETFVRNYQQSRRVVSDMFPARRARRRRTRGSRQGRALLVTVGRHFGDSSPVARRVEQALEGDYDSWVRHIVKTISRLRVGDGCLVVDRVDGSIIPGTVVDMKRDGKYRVFAYDHLLPGSGGVPLNRRTLGRLARAGLHLSFPGPVRTRWFRLELMNNVVRILQKARLSSRK